MNRRKELSARRGKHHGVLCAVMWGSVLLLTLLAALDPARLSITLLLISRSRPVQNLLVYGVGGLTACIPTMVIPLTLLQATHTFGARGHDLANSTTSALVRQIQIGTAVVVLSIAAVIVLRLRVRSRQRTLSSASSGNSSVLMLDSTSQSPISSPLGNIADPSTGGGSAIRRLRRRAEGAWTNGSVWVAFVVGLFTGGPPLDGLPFLLAIVAASGAAIGTMASALVVFVVGMFAVVEIVFVSHLVAPTKTQAVLGLLHDWALAHRPHLVAAIFTVLGISLAVRGFGIF
nr:GAP family protein [Mycobacterium shigaense]MEA1124400.1 GAP family protein [Mycobacterium shigaense]